MDGLFPELPENLSALSDEDLASLLEEHRVAAEKIDADDVEFTGELSGTEIIEQYKGGVEQIKALKAELAQREEEQKAFAEEKAQLSLEALGSPEVEEVEETEEDEVVLVELAADPIEIEVEIPQPDPAPPPDDEEEDGAKMEEKEVVLIAAAPPIQKTYRRPPTPSRDRQPTAAATGGALVASSGLRGFHAGEVLDRKGLAQALIEGFGSKSAAGGGEQVVVASAEAYYPPERRLTRDGMENAEKIAAVVPDKMPREATAKSIGFVASGGLCAPFTPIYDLPIVSVADRPVKAALAAFQATRGGISFPTPLGLGDVEEGITVVTADNDELGGTFATKACVTIACDPFTDAAVEAISACVEWGNFNARAWPERVENVAELLAAAHAREAEIELLNAIGAGSTATTDAAVYGAYSSLIQGILKAAAAYRSRHRMRADARLRVLLPAHVADLIAADLSHQQFGRMEVTRTEVAGLLRRQGVDVSFYLDSEAGAGQVYGAQNAGALASFLSTVVWYMFHEGAWLFLDFGRLDLGVVRDSILNANNDFQVFYETFEGAAMVGIESIKVTSTVCPSGEVAMATDNVITC